MNAKEEFLHAIENKTVQCADIHIVTGFDYDNYEDITIRYSLPVDYTEEEFNKFVHSLDFEYDSGYGGQLLFGNIWFTDGTWCERGEYDGSEWWAYKVRPIIPDYLIKP